MHIKTKIIFYKTSDGSKKNRQIASLENSSWKKMSTRSSRYHYGYDSYYWPSKFLTIKLFKKVEKKIAFPENLTSKKMSTGPRLFYDGSGGYDLKKNVLSIKPLKEVAKNK